jgi:hypothetical protein
MPEPMSGPDSESAAARRDLEGDSEGGPDLCRLLALPLAAAGEACFPAWGWPGPGALLPPGAPLPVACPPRPPPVPSGAFLEALVPAMSSESA